MTSEELTKQIEFHREEADRLALERERVYLTEMGLKPGDIVVWKDTKTRYQVSKGSDSKGVWGYKLLKNGVVSDHEGYVGILGYSCEKVQS